MKTAITLIRTTVLFLLLSTSLPYFVMAQHTLDKRYTYIDATRLVNAKISGDNKTINEILKLYNISNHDFKYYPLLESLENDTTYWKTVSPPVFNMIDPKNKISTSEKPVLLDIKQSERPAQDQNNQTSWEAALINGMSNFIAKRMTDEITALVIERFFDTLITNATGVKHLFPKTFIQIEELKIASKNVYTTLDLDNIRHYLILDFARLPESISNNFDSIFNVSDSSYNRTIKTVFSLCDYALRGTPPDIIFSRIASSLDIIPNHPQVISNLFHLLDMISSALKSPSVDGTIWENTQRLHFSRIFEPKNQEIAFFYELLLSQIRKDSLMRAITGIIDAECFREDNLAIIRQLMEIGCVLERNAEAFTKMKTQGNSIENIIDYIESLNNVLVFMTTIQLKSPSMDTVLTNRISVLSSYVTLVTSVLRNDFKKVFPILFSSLKGSLKISQTEKKILIFFSHLCSTSNTDEFQQMLESYALPIGSSMLKRNSKINLSINCYGGVTIGAEWYTPVSCKSGSGNIGLSAPIGVAYTFRLWNSDLNNCLDGNFSIFLSLLDLGTVVNQRLNANNASFPQLKLEHFFAPGLGIYYNLPDLPLSVGVHFNYIPNLRTIEFENSNAIITETKKSVIRLNFSVLVDIPLFTLYNR